MSDRPNASVRADVSPRGRGPVEPVEPVGLGSGPRGTAPVNGAVGRSTLTPSARPMRLSVRVVLGVVLAVVARPRLWGVACRQWWRVVPAGWWRRAPFLPLPDRGYVEFRLLTAYGATGRPRSEDVVAYLEWCADQHS